MIPHFNRLGASVVEVSRFGLGTMTFGAETDERAAHRMLDVHVDRGGTFIDTADAYAAGASESMIGRWLKARGDHDLVIATKGRFLPPEGAAGASRPGLTHAIEGSLRRLGRDHLDLYFVHGWDDETPLEETVSTLAGFVSAGTVTAVGWSNVTGWQLQRIVALASAAGCPVAAVQPQYNLLDRGIELELLPCALEAGMSIIPWSPLAGGWLTGKYEWDVPPTGASRLGENPGRGVEAYEGRNTARTHAILATLSTVAERYARPPAHVALAWASQRPGVASLLLGARNATQLEANWAAADLQLDADAMAELTRASAPGLPAYPYQFAQDWSGVAVWRQLGTSAERLSGAGVQ